MIRVLKWALVVFVVWYVMQDATKAGNVGHTLLQKTEAGVVTLFHAGRDFLDGLAGR